MISSRAVGAGMAILHPIDLAKPKEKLLELLELIRS